LKIYIHGLFLQSPFRFGIECIEKSGGRIMVKEKYNGLSQQQLLDKAYALGVGFERYSGSCSQCVAAALREVLGFEPVIVKIASSSCGGQAGLSVGTCGAVVGGTIVLDYYLGRPADLLSATREIPEGKDALHRAMEASKAFCQKFIDEYGSVLCPDVQKRIYGRSFNLQEPSDWDAFLAAGAHTDPTKCMRVVGNAARWVLEVLMEKKAILM
jgi:C_GCAxxG_C_C family probable redox protein